MQVVPEDVVAGVLAIWDADAVADLVQGGLHHHRPPTETAMPYATVDIEEGEREELSSADYLQPFTVTITAWSDTVPGDAGDIARAIAVLLDRSAPTVPHAATVLHVKPMPGSSEIDPRPRDALDVLIAKRSWLVLIHATRG